MAQIPQHKDKLILQDALRDTGALAEAAGRRTIIHNALGEYPPNKGINTALGYVNMGAAPAVFAFDLVDKLNGHEAAPGVPALALIAQAIEPITSPEHREKLQQLRQRLGWGAIDTALPLPPDAWRDQRPGDQVVRERIIGEDTLQPMYYLRRALTAADAVVRVELDGRARGTGFLVAPDLMMTNEHVIGNQEEARKAKARFFHEAIDERNKGEFRRKECVADAAGGAPLLYVNKQLDVAVIRLLNCPKLTRYLALQPVEVKQNERVAIIQHAGGFDKQISLQNNHVAAADRTMVQYYTSTTQGSSGSPVLDKDFNVIAVHHGWAPSKDPQYRNQGSSVIAILDDLKAREPELAAELLKADTVFSSNRSS